MNILPVPGEAGTGLHTHEGTGLWDAVFVMRKTSETVPEKTLKVSREQIEEVKKSVVRWGESLKDASIAFSNADKLALLRAGMVGSALRDGGDLAASKRMPLDSALTASSWGTGE